MIHPVFRLAVAQPALLAEHAAAYACLFGEELALGSAQLKRRLLFQLAALVCAAVAAVLAGVAVLLWALPIATGLPPLWLFVAVPTAPLVMALWLAWSGRSSGPAPNAFATLGHQLSADADLLRRAGAR
jgi:hypothetical protein